MLNEERQLFVNVVGKGCQTNPGKLVEKQGTAFIEKFSEPFIIKYSEFATAPCENLFPWVYLRMSQLFGGKEVLTFENELILLSIGVRSRRMNE